MKIGPATYVPSLRWRMGEYQALSRPGKFRGAAFSEGDAYIEKCANKMAKPSNQPFWKQVAISHHIMHVIEDLSKLGAAA
jgi:Beta protein